MSDSQKRFVGAVVRWLLMLAFGAIATHAKVDGAILGAAVDDATAQIVAGIGAAGTLAWSMWQKYRTNHKIATALVLPPGSTEADVNTVIKQTPSGTVPSPATAAAIVASNPTP